MCVWVCVCVCVCAGHDIVGQVSLRHIYEIAKIKSEDPSFAGVPLESVCKTLVGSTTSFGIEVVR